MPPSLAEMSSSSIQMEATGSQDGLIVSPTPLVLLDSSSKNVIHPVSNRPVPRTALIMKNVTKVSTPGSFKQTGDKVSFSSSIDDYDSDSSSEGSDSQDVPPKNNLSIGSQSQVSELSTSIPDYQVPSTSHKTPAVSVQSSSSDTESEGGDVRAPYNTKSRKKLIKQKNIKEKDKKFKLAFKAMKDGKFKSVRKCSAQFGVSRATLQRYLNSGDPDFKGAGKRSSTFTKEEEKKIIDHIVWKQEIGCGLTFEQLGLLVQEVLLGLKEANPDRVTGFEGTNQLPYSMWLRRFAERNDICLRRSMEISKGRQCLTQYDLDSWQQDTESYLLSNSVLAECFQDPTRLFNQDETSVELGSSDRRVLAKKGTKVVFHVSSGSREHITVSYACNAAGGMVPPRVIYKGVRNMAATHLQNLPVGDKSGKWSFSVSPKGYIVRSLFVEVLKDINKYAEEKNIKKPIVLIMDGANPHLSLEAAAYCKENQIQPWLLRPNMTHLTQPLDLVFFADLKKTLKKFAWRWQTDPKNTGQVLTKYSVIGLLQEVTEHCLAKPSLIQNGFKRAGLFPWNKAAPDRSKLLPGIVFAREHDQENTDISDQQNNVASEQLSNTTKTQNVSSDFPPSDISSVVSHPVHVEESEIELVSMPSPSPLLDTSSVSINSADQSPVSYFDQSNTVPTLMDNTLSESSFQPQSNSTFNDSLEPTFKCLTCDRVILQKFRDTHIRNCSPPSFTGDSVPGPSSAQSPSVIVPQTNKEKQSTKPKVTTVLPSSLDEKKTMLTKFEVLLLNPSQVAEFNFLYEQKSWVQDQPIFSSWLTLKLATIPTEKEALDNILRSHKALNVPKRKNKRKQSLPSGPSRLVIKCQFL